MKPQKIGVVRRIGRRIRAHFFTGVLVTIPLAITVGVFVWIFSLLDARLKPLVAQLSGYEIPGVGVAITLLLVYLVGVVASNVLGRRLIRWAESVVARIPVANYIYSGVRQIVQSFSAPAQTGFMQVVLVEFPRKGTRTIGFITNVLSDDAGRRMYNVFIPTCPNPTSGFLQIVAETEIIRTDLSVDDALKMVVSAGRMSPQEVSDKLFVRRDEGDVDT